MRQAPQENVIELLSTPYRVLHNDEPGPLVFNDPYPFSLTKWLVAFYHAYAPEIGNFTANYFIFLKILEILQEATLYLLGDTQDLSPEAVAACYLFTFGIVCNLLWYDLLLYIPAEKCQQFYDWLIGKRPSAPTDRLTRPLDYFIRYPAYAVSSANSTVGTLAACPHEVVAQVCGSIYAIFGTELGVVYSKMVFHHRTEQFNQQIKEFWENPGRILCTIARNSAVSLQVIKSFSIISTYYTTIGVFYLRSLAEELSHAFDFPIDNHSLSFAMLAAGILVFLTNITIRLPASVEKCTSPTSMVNKRFDAVAEFIISGACAGFLIPRLPSAGITAGAISLVIGLRAIQLRPLESKHSAVKMRRLTNWLNFISRFVKSTFLPFVAIRKIFDALGSPLSVIDLICLTALLGVEAGRNSSTTYKVLVNEHLEYLAEKRRMKLFGKIGCLFKSSQDYPVAQKEKLRKLIPKHLADNKILARIDAGGDGFNQGNNFFSL